MPVYPIEPDKLLDAATRLIPANPGRGRPPYTANRRAASTAYYAVFHAVAGRVVEQIFPGSAADFQQQARRWVAHSDIRVVSEWIAQIGGSAPGGPPAHIARILPADQIDDATARIAQGFLELHERREQADYDHSAVFSRPDTLGLIETARETTDEVLAVDTPSTVRYFGMIAFQARIQKR